MTYGIIYKITNNINGKMYIGQTINTLQKRFNDHCRMPKRKKDIAIINSAIHKYGKENFTVEELCTANNHKELDKYEIYFIALYNTVKIGYNVSLGGNGRGKVSNETRRKISIAHTGKRWSQKQKDHLSQLKKKLYKDKTNHPFYGKYHNNDTKKKIIIANQKNAKPVLQSDIDGKTINKYRSLWLAAKENNLYPESIKRVCSGKQKTSGGFKWAFVNKKDI